MEDLIGPFGLLLLFYLIPTIVAVIRGHRSVLAIGFVNLILGWTLIGWLWAMIWALSGRHVSPYRSGPDAEGGYLNSESCRMMDKLTQNPFRPASDLPKELGRKADLN